MGHTASTSKLPAVGEEGIVSNGTHEKALRSQNPSSSLPLSKGMSLSYWLQGVRNNPLLNHRTTTDIPSSAEVVIIGSGITGALCALTLLESPDPPRSVIMLEARETCSGATGRNAGHCKPDQWRGFSKWADRFGVEQSLKILANEQETWEALVKYVRDHNVDCDLWVGKSLDVLMTDELAEDGAKTFAALQAAGGKTDHIEVISDPAEAEKGAKAVYSWDASTLYPWKLVAHVLNRCLDLGLNLQTWTPVTSVEAGSGPNEIEQWVITSPRGKIVTPTVVHATNAYASALLPEVTGIIRPQPHMCNKVLPPSQFSGDNALQNSYAVVYPTGLYSVNPRAVGDGVVLVGGANPNQAQLLNYVSEDPARGADDSLVDFEPITESVRDLAINGFGWSDEAITHGSLAKYETSWSGITGRSPDFVPLIGAVPGKSGQWMCAGHNGHGMARIFTAAPALAKMIQGATYSETGLPECYQVTQERLDRLRTT